MMLASIEGNLLGLIIFAAIGAINWLLQKREEKAAKQPRPTPARHESMAPGRDEGIQEQERLRKFLEALGVPADQPPPPPVRRPVPRPRDPVSTPRGSTRPPRTTSRAPQNRPPALPPQLPRRQMSLDEADAPSLAVEALSLPPLQTAPFPVFDTVTSQISAIPHEQAAARADSDAYREQSANAVVPDIVGGLLRSRDDLRRAILLREVLGPPRGLPDQGAASTFR